jgi:hypothetical protein
MRCKSASRLALLDLGPASGSGSLAPGMKRRTIMIAALKVIALTVVSVGAPGAKTSPATAVAPALEIAGALQTSPILSTDLKAGWRLEAGGSLYSALGAFRLTMQSDGNLVLYQIDDMQIPGDVTPILLHTEGPQDVYHNAIWETGTNLPSHDTGTGAYCLMNADGNLVVYDEADRPCFQSGTKGHPGAFLRCQDDGNLVVYTRDNKALWHSQTYSRIVNK